MGNLDEFGINNWGASNWWWVLYSTWKKSFMPWLNLLACPSGLGVSRGPHGFGFRVKLSGWHQGMSTLW
jgi:hypothetical protein